MKKVNSMLIDDVVQSAINENKIVGADILIAKSGNVIYQKSAGYADRERAVLVNENTIFRLASMTKPIVSAAALSLVEKNILQLDVPIAHWLPNFKPKLADGEAPDITVRHLLNHTSGLSYGFLSEDNEPYLSAGVSDGIDEKVLSLEENLERLSTFELLYKPGESWCFSLSTDVLGAVMQAACQKELPDIIYENITNPLGMNDTLFHIDEVRSSRLAKAYADSNTPGVAPRVMEPADQVLLEGCGLIHYAPGRITNTKAYASAGAGMAGTAKDYLRFLEALRLGGGNVLSKSSIDLMTQDSVSHLEELLAGPGVGFGLGFSILRDPKKAQSHKAANTFEWGGVYGTSMFVDPKNELSVVMLTNTALEGLTGDFPVNMTQAIYSIFVQEEAYAS